MNTEALLILLAFPGVFIFFGLLSFLDESARIRQKAILPLLALILAWGFLAGLVIYVRNLPSLSAQLRILSGIAFLVSIGMIIDSIRYRDWNEAIKAALMFVAGILINANRNPGLALMGGLISGGTGLREMINPSNRVLSRTVGYLPETLWHLAKIILMFTVLTADMALVLGLIRSP